MTALLPLLQSVLSAAVLSCLLALVPGTAVSSELRLLVPAYANPCCDAGPAMWQALIAAAQQAGDRVALILNPASGPGASREPNFLDATGAGPLADFHAAGGRVYAYVATGYALRGLTEVIDEVNAYYSYYGHELIDGIFFDEMSNDLFDTGYYRTLAAHVRASAPGALVIGNPGTGFVNNPTGQTTWSVADYAGAADVLMTFESDIGAYRDAYVPPPWVATLDASHFAHVVHSLGSWDAALPALAMTRNAGWIYFTDDRMPNPYDVLAGFWSSELAAVQTSATPVTPVPLGPLTLLLVPLFGWLGWRAAPRHVSTSPR
ncbi:MAG: spherulation-specific family 4 protein [Gammaproteobacteria bacterium]